MKNATTEIEFRECEWERLSDGRTILILPDDLTIAEMEMILNCLDGNHTIKISRFPIGNYPILVPNINLPLHLIDLDQISDEIGEIVKGRVINRFLYCH